MKKLIALLIGCSLVLTAGLTAKPEQENSKNKKSKSAQQPQQAPRQPKAPNPQVQAMPKQSKAPTRSNQRYLDVPPTVQPTAPKLRDNARVRQKEGTQQNLTTLPPPPKPNSLADGRYRLTAPAVQSNKPTNQNLTTLPPDNTVVKPDKPNKLVKPNKPVIDPVRPVVQPNNVQVNENVKKFQSKHADFRARVNPSIASVQFNQNFRIRNAENWRGDHYSVFRTYRPEWRERSWWHSHHPHISLIGGGWYYWSGGYWYPAWGYDNSAAYYPYDGPIYVGSSPRPFDQVVADVQSVLQEQGYYRGEVDGLVGPLTQEALAAYQSAQGLEPTAAIDQPTLESLGVS